MGGRSRGYVDPCSVVPERKVNTDFILFHSCGVLI